MSLRKYVVAANYWLYAREKAKKLLPRRLLPFSLIIDRKIQPLPLEQLASLRNVEVRGLDIDGERYRRWVATHFPDWKNRLGYVRHKKFIEMWTTYELLSAGTLDSYMDVGGAGNTYVDQLESDRRYLQDIKIPEDLRESLGQTITYIESDASSIDLAGESLGGIASHHAFEHFQGDSDTLFICEVQRLLRVGGRCCIVPIFMAPRYAEITDVFGFDRRFDARSVHIYDPTTPLPGGEGSGHFARVYDLRAFQERVIDAIDITRFKVTMYEMSMDGCPAPDLTLNCHKRTASVESPYRALLMERVR